MKRTRWPLAEHSRLVFVLWLLIILIAVGTDDPFDMTALHVRDARADRGARGRVPNWRRECRGADGSRAGGGPRRRTARRAPQAADRGIDSGTRDGLPRSRGGRRGRRRTTPDELRLAGAPEGSTRSATSDAALFTAATYVAQVLLFLAGLLQKGLLGPVGAGYWALMQSFWTYLTLAPMGTMAGTGRQIPRTAARGDYARRAAVANSGSTFSVIAVGVAGVVLAAVGGAVRRWLAGRDPLGAGAAGRHGPLRLFSDSHKSLLQATKRFDAVSVTVGGGGGHMVTRPDRGRGPVRVLRHVRGIVLSIAPVRALVHGSGLTGAGGGRRSPGG